MMLSKPSWYLDDHMVGAAENFRRQPGETMAHAAIEDVFHFADRIFEYCKQHQLHVLGVPDFTKQSFRTFRDRLIAAEPDMALADRVANAGKHHLIRRGGIEYTSTGQFYGEEGVFWILDGNGQPHRTVDEFLTSAIAMWRRWLQTHPGL
jgi:hypothetical protein